MKWIKVAIGAVIAVLSIGIIATTVFKMTQPREVTREVSFEIDIAEGTYYPTSAFNKILEYAVFDELDVAANIVSSYLNNEIGLIEIETAQIAVTDVFYFYGVIPTSDGDIIINGSIDAEGNWLDTESSFSDNVNIKFVFEVTQPPQLTGINATLILLIPLVFVGGLLLYFYKPLKKD